MKPSDCEKIRALIPDYVFGALDEHQEQVFRRALEQCPGLSEELAEHEAMSGWMLENVPPQQAPRASVKAAIMAGASPKHETEPRTQASLIRELKQASEAPRRTRRVWLPLVAALILLFATNAYWLVRAVGVPGGDPLGIVQRSGLEAVTRVELTAAGGDGPAGALSWVMTDRDNQWVAWLTGNDLPRYAEESVYEVWGILSDGPPVKIGEFLVDELGSGALVFEIDVPMRTFERVVVTPPLGQENPTENEVIGSAL